MTGLYQIDYIEFPSANGVRSRKFFAEAFGWRHTNYGPAYDAIDDAGIDAGIQSDPAEATAGPLAVIRTSDLEQAECDVLAAGGVITRGAYDFPGGRRFHFREPGGIELAVWVARE